MKFRIKKGILEAAVNKASGMVSKDDVRPILKNYLLQVEPTELKIVATDEELAAVASVRVITDVEPGSITVPANKFQEIVTEAVDVEGEVAVEGTVCTIKFGRSKWRLQGMPADQYPAIEDFGGEGIIAVDREKILGALKKVGFAVGRDVSRPSLMGAFLSSNELCATDGHRIQVTTFEHGISDMLVPAPALDQLVRVLDLAGSKNLEILRKERYILFRVGSDIYLTRILEATYPDVKKIIGKTPENPRILKVDKESLVGAVKRMRVNADPDSKAIKFEAKGTSLVISTIDDKGNTGEEDMPCTWSGTETLVKGVNFDYLLELLTVLDSKEVSFKFGEDTEKKQSPFRVEEGSLVGVILPLRLTF